MAGGDWGLKYVLQFLPKKLLEIGRIYCSSLIVPTERPSETFQTAFSVESATVLFKTADFQIKLRCRNRCGGAGHPGLVRGRGRL